MSYMFYSCINLKEFRGEFKLNGDLLPTYAFELIFSYCVNLIIPPNKIPGKILQQSSCIHMFSNCYRLPYIPNIEAEILSGNQCCYNLFNQCREIKEIKNPPTFKEIYGTQACYAMFNGCYKLKNAFELPATILANNCYQAMFNGCTNLISGCSILPATHIPTNGYDQMFSSCPNLIQAPEICAETYDTSALRQMFDQDGKINKIKVHFTEWKSNSDNYTWLWVRSVSPSGEFICPSALPEVRGNNNIPNNWTITRF